LETGRVGSEQVEQNEIGTGLSDLAELVRPIFDDERGIAGAGEGAPRQGIGRAIL
jgi:hypothetical protein